MRASSDFLGAAPIILLLFRLPVCYVRYIIHTYNVLLRITATMNLYYNLHCTKKDGQF